MVFTVFAAFCGSSASSQPLGLPVSTAQNLHARVHTEPIIINVAVPRDQHSPMFGHLASWHTVLKSCSVTRALIASNFGSCCTVIFNHAGLRSAGTWLFTDEATPSLIALIPWRLRYFCPLSTTTGMSCSLMLIRCQGCYWMRHSSISRLLLSINRGSIWIVFTGGRRLRDSGFAFASTRTFRLCS